MNEVIILGMGQSRTMIPWGEVKGIPIWSCNNGYLQIAEMNGFVNKIFLSHTQHKQEVIDKNTGKIVRLIPAYNYENMNRLVEHGVEIYNIHRMRGLKHKMYPLERIDKKFGVDGFFSNTISYMLAYALDISTKVVDGKVVKKEGGFDKIRIYGVDMLTKDEYELEKGGLEFWIGYAKGLGIDVWICEGSAICKTCTGKPYGVKFFDPTNFDPWTMLEFDGKDKMWAEQAMPTKRQIKAMQKSLRRGLKL